MSLSRRKLREQIFSFLFRIEFNTKEEVLSQMAFCFERRPDFEKEDTDYIASKTEAIIDAIDEIDEIINESCQGWRLSRLGKAELAIIRLAIYEIKNDDDVPAGVAINEAVELGKIYCSEEAPRFINGVLAKLV